MWGWDTPANCGARCNDFQLSREFMQHRREPEGRLPYQPGVEDLVKKRTAAQDQIPMFIACRAARRESGPTTITSGSFKSLTGSSF